MFKHEKKLFHPVEVEGPNPQYAALLQEQLGGANGELKAAMQYMSVSYTHLSHISLASHQKRCSKSSRDRAFTASAFPASPFLARP